MGSFFRILMRTPLLSPIVRPLTRFLIGMIAIPVFRLILKKVIRLQQMDAELEKDLEQWFRAALLLLVASANMEPMLFDWIPQPVKPEGDMHWVMMGFRILLAISVVEAMPDQELFAIIHPGPPKLNLSRKYGIWREIHEKKWPLFQGIVCQHLNRSSPVFAILAAIATGWIGWLCYGLAGVQYLIIGLVTSKDEAMKVLNEFDKQVAIRRREIVDEFVLDSPQEEKPTKEPSEKKRESAFGDLPDNAP